MTTPTERADAILDTGQFLDDLMRKYKRVPAEVKDMAYSLMRHYPSKTELGLIADKCPEMIKIHVPN